MILRLSPRRDYRPVDNPPQRRVLRVVSLNTPAKQKQERKGSPAAAPSASSHVEIPSTILLLPTIDNTPSSTPQLLPSASKPVSTNQTDKTKVIAESRSIYGGISESVLQSIYDSDTFTAAAVTHGPDCSTVSSSHVSTDSFSYVCVSTSRGGVVAYDDDEIFAPVYHPSKSKDELNDTPRKDSSNDSREDEFIGFGESNDFFGDFNEFNPPSSVSRAWSTGGGAAGSPTDPVGFMQQSSGGRAHLQLPLTGRHKGRKYMRRIFYSGKPLQQGK